MPKKRKIPTYGRKEKHVKKDIDSLRNYSADVHLGNTDPTVVQGKIYGGMPNRSRMARGGLKKQRGRNT